MLQAKIKKSLSVLLSATMLASMCTSFAVTASADDTGVATQATGVQTFTEDFSSYTADTVATEKVMMLEATAGNVAATHPSGAKWVVPQTSEARGTIGSTMAGKYWFQLDDDNPEKNILKIQGMDYRRAQLNLDTSAAFKVDKFKKFEFRTIAAGESIGTRLFVNEKENCYLEFSFTGERSCATESGEVPKQMPKVVYSHGGTRTILYNAGEEIEVDGEATTRGKADGWKEGTDNNTGKHLKWTIAVNDDNSLTWTVTTEACELYTAGEATSTGTIPAEIAAPLMMNYAYPLAAMGDGDNQWGKYESVSFDYIPADKSTASFVEDFSSYTEDTVATAQTQVVKGDVIATHPSGATWVVDKYSNGSKYYFDVTNDMIYLKGWGSWSQYTTVDLNASSAINAKKYKSFRFRTYTSGEAAGLRLFVSSDGNSYIEFVMNGHRRTAFTNRAPRVIVTKNSTENVKYNGETAVTVDETETTMALKDGWLTSAQTNGNENRIVDWTVNVNDDGSLTWCAVSAGGGLAQGAAASYGTIPASEASTIMANAAYPVAMYGEGDGFSARILNVTIDYIPDNTTSFVEDFSSYTADTVETEKTTAATGDVIATHPSGSTWEVGKQVYGAEAVRSAYRFDVTNDRLILKGWGDYWNDLNVDLHMDSSIKIKSLESFRFTTYLKEEDLGVRLFTSSDHKTYIEFGMAGGRRASENYPKYMPYVILNNNGTATQKFSSATVVDDTTQGLKDGWTTTRNSEYIVVDWTVDVNEDGSLTWSAVSSYATSSGTISAEEAAPMTMAYNYPVTLVGYGDEMNSAYGKVQINYIPDTSTTFTEDFTSYTADTVATENTDAVAGEVVAVHPSGAKWIVDQTSGGGKYKFDVAGDRLVIKGWSSAWDETTFNLDLNSSTKVEKYEIFKFRTYSQYEDSGVRLFVNTTGKNENNNEYIQFAVAGNRRSSSYSNYMPYVESVALNSENKQVATRHYDASEAVTVDGTETTRGLADGWTSSGNAQRYVDWTVTVNEDGSLDWEAVSAGGGISVGTAKSSGTISAEVAKPFIEKHTYPVALYAYGDGFTSSIENISIRYQEEEGYTAPDFHEDFKDYKADDNTVTSSYLVREGQKVIATHLSGAKWITSTKHTDLSNYAGAAYIDVANDRLATKGWGTYHLQRVLLDYSDKKYDINKVQFTSQLQSSNDRLVGISMFIDGQNENNYLFFGQLKSDASVLGLSNGETSETKFAAYAPVIAKVVNGTATPLVYTAAGTTTDWSGNDKEVTWTIEFDKNNNIKWTAASSNGTSSSGTVTADDDINKIIEANWAYPLASTGIGDDFTFIKSVDMWTSELSELTYEKKAYTRGEFKELFESAVYGKASDVEKLMKLDLNGIDGGEAEATVTVGTSTRNVTSRIFGAHTEYSPGYTWMADENGNISDEFKTAAEKLSPIATYRIGGGGSTGKNMLKDLKNEDSYYLEAAKLPSHMQENAGTVSYEHQAIDVATLINGALANNPNASFNLVISPYTTTPEEVKELITILTDSNYSTSRAAYGLPESPINIEYIELGNELEHMNDLDKSRTFADWYGENIPAYITAVEEADASIKIIANGMTCPWSGVNSYNFWLDMIAATRTVGSDTGYRISDHVDAISFHPYYDWGNSGAPALLSVMDSMKSYLDEKAPGNNVKFCITEHNIGWRQDGQFSNYETSSFKSALVNSAFISMAASREHVEPALFEHGTYGQLWQRINNNMISPLGEVYSFLSKEWKDTLVDTTVSIAEDEDVVGTYQNYFTASTVKSSANEIKLILTNAADYKSVNTAFNLPGNYTLVNEKILTAPNPYTATYNKNCEGLVTETSNDVEVANFSAYEVPASSIVVLTLRIPDGKAEFVENFDYADKDVTASAEAQTVATNANGAVWKTSSVNNGHVEEGVFSDESYGKVSIANKALVIENSTDESDKAVSANWDISAVTAKPSAISEISFTINGDNGGVKLFTDADEASEFDFSNKTVGLTGTVTWNITIADGTLSYSASNTVETKTGTMAITDADMTGYTYLASAYLNSGVNGSATFDSFSFRYGNDAAPEVKGVTYTVGDSTVDVTVNPSVYGKSAVRVFVGYYNGDTLVGAYTGLASNDGDVLNLGKTSSTYTTAKIFVWDNSTQEPLATAVSIQ